MTSHLWFHEVGQHHFGIQIRVRRTLCHVQSPYQEIMLLETEGMGRMMILDGCVMLTERDEFLYHEMLAHPAMCSHPNPKRVLVIGGGDGGTVRELLRYPEIESIDLVELDEQVVRVSQEFLPEISAGLTDPRVTMHFRDGVVFLEERTNTYDIIFIDSTDPVGPAAGLIAQEFFANCKRALRGQGIVVMQSESPFVHAKEIKQIHHNLRPVFPNPQLYLSPMLSYPSGWWSFTMVSEKFDARRDFVEERCHRVSKQLEYYNPAIHQSAFTLPNFVQRMLNEPQDA